MTKKHKFDLTGLVHKGYLSNEQTLFFVSDPSKTCKIFKLPNGEFKVKTAGGQTTTIHAFAMQCLESEPPEHASKWLRTQDGKTLYEIWHSDDTVDDAA